MSDEVDCAEYTYGKTDVEAGDYSRCESDNIKQRLSFMYQLFYAYDNERSVDEGIRPHEL